jgi:diguanylate cyclase
MKAFVKNFLQPQNLTGILKVSALATTFAVAVSVTVVHIAVISTGGLPWVYHLSLLAIAAAIPLLITFPFAFLLFDMMRQLRSAVLMLNSHVRIDALTSTLTRAYFLTEVRELSSKGGALFMLDLDHFKRINDNFGHAAGDYVLSEVGRIMLLNLPKNGIVGRLGGEEFGIFINGVSQEESEFIAWQINKAIAKSRFSFEERFISVTASLGVKLHKPMDLLQNNMRKADELLYQAKNSGRNRVVSDTVSILSSAA